MNDRGQPTPRPRAYSRALALSVPAAPARIEDDMSQTNPTRQARSIKEPSEAKLASLASQAVDAYLAALKAHAPEAQDLGVKAISACLDYLHAPQTPKLGRLFWAIQARSIALKIGKKGKTGGLS